MLHGRAVLGHLAPKAEATLLALFGERDRIDCELGVLVREPDGAGGWRFRIEVEP